MTYQRIFACTALVVITFSAWSSVSTASDEKQMELISAASSNGEKRSDNPAGNRVRMQVANIENECTETSARLLAQAFARTFPISQGELVGFLSHHQSYFLEDGGAIQCARKFADVLIPAGINSYDAHAYERAMNIGPPELARGVANSVNSTPANMLTIGMELRWLAEVLPEAARNNLVPFHTSPSTSYRQQLRRLAPVALNTIEVLCQTNPSTCRQIIVQTIAMMESASVQMFVMLAQRIRS